MASILSKVLESSPRNHQGSVRRMGVEIELAGVEPAQIAAAIASAFGGKVNWQSPFEIVIEGSQFGDFKLELDSARIKELGENSEITGDPSCEPAGFERSYIEFVSGLAVKLVPWEIVTPPIPLAELPELYPLIDTLREQGALGTREAPHYAFGVHLNPELKDHSAASILRVLQSFVCLYDWIRHIERTDLMRRVTPYINHFGSDYLHLITAKDYKPNVGQLTDDYLEHNPTRNRSLDMLPLFKYLDEDRVVAQVGDERINARPTFHYRLPNCEIDNSNWNLNLSIEMWMSVEALAMHPVFDGLLSTFHRNVNKLLPVSSKQWVKQIQDTLRENGLYPDAAESFESV